MDTHNLNEKLINLIENDYDEEEFYRLIEEGADVNCTNAAGDPVLFLAVKYDFGEYLIDYLIEKGADIDMVNKFNETPLLKAASLGHIEAIEILLSNKANPNCRSKWGSTPLMFAAGSGHLNVILSLLKHGADIDAINNDGEDILFFANSGTGNAKGKTDVLEFLNQHFEQRKLEEIIEKEMDSTKTIEF